MPNNNRITLSQQQSSDEALVELSKDNRWSQLKPEETIAVPGTYAQQALHFVQSFQPESVAYHIPFDFRFDKELSPDALEKALYALVLRHDILRTGFEQGENGLQQIVHGVVNLPHELVEAGQWTEQNIRAYTQQWAREPFDLTQPPLFKSKLLRLKNGWAWYLCFHHIAFDHMSIVQFAADINAAYQRALINPDSVSLAPMPLSVVDYAVWQEEHQRIEYMRDKITYWQEAVPDASVHLDLPTDFPRPAVMTGKGQDYWFEMDEATSNLARQTAKQCRVSRYLLTMTQLAVVLHRYSKAEQFLLGTPFANRSDQAELQNVLGCFMNTLPLPFDFSDKPTFRTLLNRTQQHFLKIFERQDVPFQQLIETLKPPRDTSHHPLYQVAFMYQDPPMQINLGGAEGVNQHLHSGSSKFDMTFWLWDEPNGQIKGNIEFSTEVYELSSIQTLLDVYSKVIRATCLNLDAPIAELPLVDLNDPFALALKGPEHAFDASIGLHGLVAAQVKTNPNALAVASDDGELTYQELWAKVSAVASFIREKGVEPGSYIGVSLNRSTQLLVATLGILQAGCAYVPLDPEYPQDRLAYMVEHSQMPLVLTEEACAGVIELLDVPQAPVLLKMEQVEPQSELSDAVSINPEQPAYVIYTSGSTGLPKGVVVPHRSVVNFMQSMAYQPGFKASDRLLAVTTLSFDISVLELFLPLTQGGAVYVAPADVAKDPVLLDQCFKAFKPSVMQATPATWRMLVIAGWQGSDDLKLLVGGEALPEDLVDDLLLHSGQVWNMYGPTETTIWSTCFNVVSADEPVVIGSPLQNTDCYILDDQLQPLPPGVPGELMIGGAGVALGYLHREDLTQERFIPNPVTGAGLLYRTGDLVTRLSNGQLKYHNRLDNQVKIRGFRIELGEVEQVLLKQEQVQGGAVVVQGQGFDKRLVAFYQIKDGEKLSIMKLKRALSDALPKHMVPELLVSLDVMPLTPSGKIDRKSLSQYKVQTAEDVSAAQQPTTYSELYYAEVWKKILKRDVGINDNFFDIGGHSLASLSVVAAAKKNHGVIIPANALVMNTLGQLAAIYPIPEPEKVEEPEQEKAAEPVFEAAAVQVENTNSVSNEIKETEGDKKPWWKRLF